MPIYVYECEKCGNKTDVIAALGCDKPLRCNICSHDMRRTVAGHAKTPGKWGV